jgi:homoserine dehydrogenase
VLAALRYGLAGDRIVRACGILNGTCNFILSKMEANGTTLATALAEAQRLGYAESDPSDDVNGVDAACKVAIVARMALQAGLNAFEIPKQSITGIQPEDFHYARQLGCTIRQISLAEVHREKLRAAVGPALISLKSPLAACVENQNAVVITGENSGDTLLAGRGAGAHPTAVAIVSDLLAIVTGGYSSPAASRVRKYPPAELNCARYLRVRHNGIDFSGILTNLLHAHGGRIQKWLDKPSRGNHLAAFTVDACSTAAIGQVVMAMESLEGISQKPFCLPILA